MKIVCISDTHNNEIDNIPDGDILIHAGDFSYNGKLEELIRFNVWMEELPHKYKILIPGNHDFCFENNYDVARKLFTAGSVLINSEISIEGIKFYGTPDQPVFYNWAFNKASYKLKQSYSNIPNDTDILITHTPPLWKLDEVRRGHVGSEELLTRVQEVKPKYHIFGHIHESYGILEDNDTTFINAAICDEWYDPINDPIVFDI